MTAVFAGSFDPLTLGHESVIERALPLFDEIIVTIGVNGEKSGGMFSPEVRKALIEARFASQPRVRADIFTGLTADYCRAVGARFLLRGLRSAADLEFEQTVAHANKLLAPDLETVFLLTDARYGFISSSVVRDILKHGGDISAFVSKPVLEKLKSAE